VEGRGGTVFDRESTTLLEAGSALIVATVAPDGSPLATRGWGLTVLGDDPPTVRLLLNAHETTTLGHVEAGGAIAVTAADVPTLRSLQLKGRAVALEPATADDVDRAGRYVEALFADIAAADGADPAILRRWLPLEYVAATLEVDDCFDQTPGPGAGSPLPEAAP
jgi:hypothetical protein